MKIEYLLEGWKPEEVRTLNDIDTFYVDDSFNLFFLRDGYLVECVEKAKIAYVECTTKVNE